MAASDPFYQELVSEVNTILEELGKSFTIRANGVYDPNTMTKPVGGTRSAYGVVSDNKDFFNLATQLSAIAEGSGTLLSRRSLLLAPASNPKPFEEIQVDGLWYSLGSVRAVKPADVAVLYILELTR